MARSRSPSCHSVSVTWQRLSPEAPEPLQAPAQVQALFHGDRLLVYGFIPRCTQATLRALTQEKEFSTMVSTTELQKTTGTMIHKLTARALIRDYEDGILHDDETNHEMKKQVLKSLIIQLSKENCLVTQFTSFVAVEKRDGNESFLNNPNILELVAKDVDLLPYMDWQEEQPCGFGVCGGSAWQPLSAFSGWHGEFRPKLLSKRKQKPSTVKGFGDVQGLSLAFKAPKEPFKFGWKYAHAEMPLDLSQMEPRTYKGACVIPMSGMSPQMAGFSSFAAPASAGSPATLGSISFSPPCPPHAPLFGSSGAALSGPATSDPGPDTGRGTNVFLERELALRGPPPNPPVEPFSGSAFAGGLFGFGQFSLSTTEGLKACGKSGTLLEVDSSSQPSPPFSPPSPPPPCSAGASLRPLSDSSTFNFLESAAPLSTSYKQPAHVFGLAHHLFGASPSSLPARNAVSHQGLRSAAPSSLGTENDETQGFLRMTPFKKVDKSHVAGREFTASSQARENQGFGICQQSQWRSMLWTRLFRLQTEDGFWKLTPELGFILNLNTDILNNFLEQKGIRSLGVKGRERLLDLIATFLVLQFLRTQLEQKGIVFKSLMRLDDAAVSRDILWASEKIKKASEWVRRTEGQYTSICQRLELGKDWDSATKQLLRLQPVNTTSPLHRVLNYSPLLIGNL